jgi:hypothetical protein
LNRIKHGYEAIDHQHSKSPIQVDKRKGWRKKREVCGCCGWLSRGLSTCFDLRSPLLKLGAAAGDCCGLGGLRLGGSRLGLSPGELEGKPKWATAHLELASFCSSFFHHHNTTTLVL